MMAQERISLEQVGAGHAPARLLTASRFVDQREPVRAAVTAIVM
jgi:hypothetical protein